MLSPSLRRTVPDRLHVRWKPRPIDLLVMVVTLSSMVLPAYGLAVLVVEALP